jgi:hypothetical protein
MMIRWRIKPTRLSAVLGVIWALAILVVGLREVHPSGPIGLVWILIMLAIIGFNVVRSVTGRSFALFDVRADAAPPGTAGPLGAVGAPLLSAGRTSGRERYRVTLSKPRSLLQMIVGLGFVLIGVTVVVPSAGLFGIVWTLGAAFITIVGALNVFTKRGIAFYEAEGDETAPPAVPPMSEPEVRLRQLTELHQEGLLSDEALERKRAEVAARIR